MPQRPRPKLTFESTGAPRPSRLTWVAIAATLIVGLSAAGCGSSSKSTSKSTTAITKPEFLAKANAICTQGNAQNQAVVAKLGKSPTPAQVTASVKSATIPGIQAQINRVRALGAPSGDKAKVTNMLNLAQADLNKVKSNPALLQGNSSPFADFAKIAHPYGLTACARGA
jgi:hypothetical protein